MSDPTQDSGAGSLVVQQSFPSPRPTTNPYLVMLRDAIGAVPGVEVRTFSWRSALLGRYDVFHVHWPEILVQGRTPGRALVRQLLTVGLLVRLRLTRTPIVRTLHNLAGHEQASRPAKLLLSWLDRQTALVVTLNPWTTPPSGVPAVTIPHGHFQGWFAGHDRPEPVSGRFGYFGLIRPYKGVDQLLRAFAALLGDYSLHIAGNPSAELRGPLSDLAAADERVELELAYVPDADLVRVVGESELVVLPYREMHNSGVVLTALSLDRPVLVPDNEVNARLAEEVGRGWVFTYVGELTADRLAEGMTATRSVPRSARPDLSERDWELAGRSHVAAYRQAIERLRAGGRSI